MTLQIHRREEAEQETERLAGPDRTWSAVCAIETGCTCGI